MNDSEVPLSLAKVVRPEAGWYRGDFHAHTNYSDGYHSPPELANVAREAGLDFFAITDHNTIEAYARFGPQPNLLIIPGVEATFDEGHFNIFGVAGWSEWMDTVCTGRNRAQLTDDFQSFTDLLRRTASEGLLNSMNHPLLSPWDWRAGEADLRFMRCLEIWNDPSWPENKEANPQAVALWTDLLNAGHRITAIGGSDYHRPVPQEGLEKPAERLGYPSTYVLADELSGAAILAGLRLRRAYVSLGPQVTFQAHVGGRAYDIGYDLGLVQGAITFTARVSAAGQPAPMTARLIGNGRTVAEWPAVDGETHHVEAVASSPAEPTWYRLDVVDQQGAMLAITNPLFAGPERPPQRTRYEEFI